MAAKKATDPGRQLQPVRVAPLGTLNAYTVYEHELDEIAAGSPATLSFNFAIALLSAGLALVLALTTTTIASDRLFYGYLLICVNFLLVGFGLLIYWPGGQGSRSGKWSPGSRAECLLLGSRNSQIPSRQLRVGR